MLEIAVAHKICHEMLIYLFFTVSFANTAAFQQIKRLTLLPAFRHED